MIFEISHKTTYTYSRPVFLELHHLRLRPRSDGVQHVACFDSKVEPRPSGSADGLDIDGNSVENVWFQGLSEQLVIESRAKVITRYRHVSRQCRFVGTARRDRHQGLPTLTRRRFLADGSTINLHFNVRNRVRRCAM